MAKYFQLMIIMVTLAYVSCLPLVQEDQSDSAEESSIEEAASEEDEIDLRSYGYKDSNTESDEEFLDSDVEDGPSFGEKIISRMSARKYDIKKLLILLKVIDHGVQLKGGVDQISSGIDLKKEGYKEIFNKETFKSGLEKSIEGDELVLKGMKQSSKALFYLGLDGAYAIAINRLASREEQN